jgi:hypothetical protein
VEKIKEVFSIAENAAAPRRSAKCR